MKIGDLKSVMRYGGAEEVELTIAHVEKFGGPVSYETAKTALRDVDDGLDVTQIEPGYGILRVTCEVWE